MSPASPYRHEDGRPISPSEAAEIKRRKRAEAARRGHASRRIDRELAQAEARHNQTLDASADAEAGIDAQPPVNEKRRRAALKAAATLRERKFKSACDAKAEERMSQIIAEQCAERALHADDPPGTLTRRQLRDLAIGHGLEAQLYREAHVIRAQQPWSCTRRIHLAAHLHNLIGNPTPKKGPRK